MQFKFLCFAIAIFSASPHLFAQPNAFQPNASQAVGFNHGQAIRFVLIDVRLLPTATSQDITTLLTQAKARIIEPMAVTGVLTVAFDISSRDESLAFFKASPIVEAVEFKTP